MANPIFTTLTFSKQKRIKQSQIFSSRCARNNNFSQTTFSVWVSFSPTPEHRGASYWKFVFPDPLGTAEKFAVVVIVIFLVIFSNLPRIYSKLEILLFWLTRFLLHKLFLSKMRFNNVNFFFALRAQ